MKSLFKVAFILSIISISYAMYFGKIERIAIKDSYKIVFQNDEFQIPASYIVYKGQRFDTADLAEKDKTSRDYQHGSIFLAANLPDMSPIKDEQPFAKPPALTDSTIGFAISEKLGGAEAGINNIIASEKGSSNFIKSPSTIKTGLVKIGYKINRIENEEFFEDLYIFYKNETPLSFITCTREKSGTYPHCSAILLYNKTTAVDVKFRIKNLEWYAKQSGLDKILNLIQSWSISSKPPPSP